VALSWTHGDFTPDNLFVSPDARLVTGVIDWESAQPEGMVVLDLLHFLISTRILVERRDLGELMPGLLTGSAWLPHEKELLQHVVLEVVGIEIAQRSLLLLCWLQHVAANLTKSTRYGQHSLWLAKNVLAVLNTLYPTLPSR
jgi:hypothetical protein